MVILPSIIHVILLTFILEVNSESIKQLKVTLKSGRRGSLMCPHSLNIKDKSYISYWQKEDKTICYVNIKVKCAGFHLDVDKKEITLTIPEVKSSDSGNYTGYLYTKDENFECKVNLLVGQDSRMLHGSHGICTTAGPFLLLLPLAVVIWNFPFLLL
ncbi:uncharacterized protein LOC144608712 [Rhinoraja longicauda]